MSKPQIELIPLRQAASQDQPTELDLLIRVTAHLPPPTHRRPPVNVGLVIDRSGSMAGAKIEYAKIAARTAISMLTPEDRVSVTVFDDQVETVVPSTHPRYPDALWERLRGITPGGRTALHEGWRQGGLQVSSHLSKHTLNRVILLSDGQANHGITDPRRLAADAGELARLGVSTTTMGIGDDYNEDLMQRMGEEGDGNYYDIESPEGLETLFRAELAGLTATSGKRVSLGIEVRNDVRVLDVLNDFGRLPTGRLKLPNLVVGQPLFVVVRLWMPPIQGEKDICRVRLTWDGSGDVGRQSVKAVLNLPGVPQAQLAGFPEHPLVQERIAILTTARYRSEAVRCLDKGDHKGLADYLELARDVAVSSPMTQEVAADLAGLEMLAEDMRQGHYGRMRKRAGYQSETARRGRKDPLSNSPVD